MQTLRRNLLTTAVLLLSVQMFGQGVTIESVVDTRIEGALGSMVGLAARMTGNSLHDIATTTYLQGHQLRTDSARSGTIYDLDAERVINIDHKQKTYSSMTFAEMKAAMEQARASAAKERAKEEAKAAKADPNSAGKKGDIKLKYHVAVDRPGGVGGSNDYETEQVLITITLEAEATPEGEKTEQVGSMVLLLDQRIAKNAPGVQAYAAFYRLFSQKFGREFRSQVQGLQAVFASDPRLKEGFDAAGKEMQKVPGIAMLSWTHAILVPPNMTFDRQLALNNGNAIYSDAVKSAEAAPAEKPKSGFGGFMRALKTAAEDASKQMDNGNQKKNSPPQQRTLLVLTEQVRSVTTGAVPSMWFAPPAGYREVKQKTP